MRRLFTDHVAAARIVLVTAPTGSGKTTALTDWASWSNREKTDNISWIGLDKAGDHPAQLLAQVVHVLSAATSLPGAEELLASSAGSEWRTLLPEVLLWLERLPEPVTLVIDRLQAVRTGEVHHLLEQLIRYACPRLRLVLATQTRSCLPRPDLRSGGHVLAVPAHELLFTRAEADALCEERGVEPTGDLLGKLMQATGGWPHSLTRAVSDLACGSALDVQSVVARAQQESASLLAKEAAAHEAEGDWLTLLRLSVTGGPLDSGLAGLVADRPDAGRVLHHSADDSGLVTSHENGYRFLPGVEAPLRVLAHERLGPEAVEKIHRTAAEWHRDHGSPVRAVEHALLARDFSHAWEILRGAAIRLCLSGRGEDVLRLLSRFDKAQDAPSPPEADALHALALTVLGRAEDAAAVAERAEQGSVDKSGPTATAWTKWAIAVVHLMQCHRDGDLGAAMTHSEVVRKALSRTQSSMLSGSPREHEALLAPYLAMADWWQGDSKRARRHLNASRLDAELHGRTDQADNCAALGLLLSYLDGQTANRPDHLPLLDSGDIARALGNAYSSFVPICASRRAWEQGDLPAMEQAVQQIDRTSPVLRALCDTEADLLRAELHLSRKNTWAALRAVASAEARHKIGAPAGWRARIVYTGARTRLALGRTNDATALLPKGSMELQHPYGRLAAALVKLAGGAAGADVLTLLEPLRDCTQWLNSFRAEAWLLSARAWQLSGRPGLRVRQAIHQAMSLAHEAGNVRIFQEHASWCRPLLVACAADTGDPEGHVTSLLKALSPNIETGIQLSRRELEVMTLLVGDLTLSEIAEQLSVSVNTVKTQARSIYRKLGVSKRRGAVAEARARGLLG
ncbi:hypothetical protein I5Q34_33920 [Streptomyces sp. AV19]|uniref:LuxR C-terminal-related transcriptional regulator n=1 Tax=Streptomyces sp. AV19 TaxID=2793068 RepID=UPI0018FEC851|nr:LuxR C-terminal-related transcriptional regulator [Streptomyces sp. AV19]MBH1939200.1 hypothetical protein [Streptomyces sp. AV19]MDG4536930.1 LuxR C-terminal-related transcriptional regulator [Streptomyces sp. AV19]